MAGTGTGEAGRAAGPVDEGERLFALDAIRGFALFGVLLINLSWVASPDLALPADIRDALPTAPVDRWLRFFLMWLFEGKAQALFSMLFGLGFAIQLQRAQARGPGFAARYLRRLAILAVLGFGNLYLLWMGDILHAYALMGMLLLAVRGASDRGLLAGGLLLSLLAMPLFELSIDLFPDGPSAAVLPLWQAGVEPRFQAWTAGGYGAYLANNVASNWREYLGTVMAPFFMAHVLGRFLLGYWIARRGWLQDVAEYAAGFRRALPVLLVGGLLLGLPGKLPLLTDNDPEGWLYHLCNLGEYLAMLMLAAGYAAAIALWSLSPAGRRWLAGMAALGRMALTQYLLHAVVYLGVFTSVGLNLLPKAGACLVLAVTLLAYGLQLASSQWWLARFRFGPMEWLWRWLTYGQRPAFRR